MLCNFPVDVFCRGIGILVMGLTGAGKSTLISQITEHSVEIGHSLGSCTFTQSYQSRTYVCAGTMKVRGYPYRRTNGQVVWLIDTPGFDDTNKANTQILREIVSFLCTFCNNHRLSIGGLLYVHRITDVRMSSSSLKSLRIFEALCGEACFADVTIVTTMWDMIQAQDEIQAAETRETTLRGRGNFFGRLLAGGALYHRHQDTYDSSLDIVEQLVDRRKEVVLAVQEQMERAAGVTLADTTVGRYLEGDLKDTRKKYERQLLQLEAFNKTLRGGNDNMDAELGEQKQLIAETGLSIDHLLVTYDEMRKERGVRLLEEAERPRTFEEEAVVPYLQQSSEETIKLSRSATERQSPFTETEETQRVKDIVRLSDQRLEDISIRERNARETMRKEPASFIWQTFLRALIGKTTDPDKELVHQLRRSSSLPPETKEQHHERKAGQIRKGSETRERRVLTKSPQLGIFDGRPPSIVDQQEIIAHGTGRMQSLENSINTQPQPLRLNEIRMSSPEATAARNGLQAKVVWDNSGLTRSYGSSSNAGSPLLRRSPMRNDEQMRNLYN